MSIPLLRTKLYVPPQRPPERVVPRPRLMARLGEALRLGHRLTLVSAKAGSGKTTAVSEWLHKEGQPAAWLSLDANDNDPRRFVAYLVATLHEVGVPAGQAVPGQLETPQMPEAEAVVAALVNEVAASSTPFLLVLDDYHLIQEAWIHEAVGFLAEHQPPEMHLVLITRVDPPLPLARLRGKGQMTEVRDHDLRFTAEEAAWFVNRTMGLDLPAEAVATLERRTEGWIVGLQMAALAAQAMQGRKQDADLAAFVEAFGGTNRYVLDYLMEEVLNQQPPAMQDFLVETSILERMCGELCDAVVVEGEKGKGGKGKGETLRRLRVLREGEGERGEGAGATDLSNGQAILAHLEQANLFVTPLDDERRWYRYHHLFADLLKRTLGARRSEEAIRALYRRASQWHQGAGSLEEAVSYAMSGRDYERAASMIEARFSRIFSRSEVPVLLGWIEQLPEALVRNRPWIDAYRASTLVLAGQLEEVDALLDGVERRVAPGGPQAAALLGHVAAVRAYAANLRGDAARAIEMAALTAQYLPEEHLAARGMAAYTLADTCLASDDVAGARQALSDMLRVGEKTGQLLVIVPALCDLATVERIEGRLHQAGELLEKAREWMVARNGLASRERCGYEFGLADLLREWNQLDAAYEHAKTGMAYRQRLGGYWVVGDLPWMRILQARGDVEGALAALRNVEQVVESHSFQLAALIAFRTARVVQWLAVGDVETASRWAEACSGGSEVEQIALARLRLAQGRAGEAQGLLQRQGALAESGGRRGRWIEIQALLALALEAQGQGDEAEAALAGALFAARPEGYVRTFLDLGRPLCALLERLAARGTPAGAHGAEMARITGAYVRALLDGFAAEREAAGRGPAAPPSLAEGEAGMDALTEREVEVLQLLAEGLSNKAIAGRLVVAPSTVKQHLKNIYGKLEVHSRTQAVARGRELDLL